MAVPDYVISPFECAIELTDLEPNLGEQLFELCMDLEAKSLSTRSGFCTLWRSALVTKRHAKLSVTVLRFLLAFPNFYVVESGVSHINSCLINQRNRLEVGERGDLRLELTNIHELIKSHQLHPSHMEMCFFGKLLN